MRKILASVSVIVLLTFLLAGRFHSQNAVSVRTVGVERGSIYQFIESTGKVVSQSEVSVSAPLPGQIINVYSQEGDIVPKGKILARLDDRDALRTFKKSEANLLRVREETMRAEQRLERVRRVFEVGGESHQAVDEANTEWKIAQAKEKIAKEDLLSAQITLDRHEISAPFTGLIISKMVQTGQWVGPETILYTLVKQNSQRIEVKLDPEDIGTVSLGQTTFVSSNVFPGTVWNEKVIQIAPSVKNENSSATISVLISLNPATTLKIGQQVDIKIQTKSKSNILKLPFGAIKIKDQGGEVGVVRDDHINFVPVVLGIEDLTHTEISGDIKEEELAILLEGVHLSEGDWVKPTRMDLQ